MTLVGVVLFFSSKGSACIDDANFCVLIIAVGNPKYG